MRTWLMHNHEPSTIFLISPASEEGREFSFFSGAGFLSSSLLIIGRKPTENWLCSPPPGRSVCKELKRVPQPARKDEESDYRIARLFPLLVFSYGWSNGFSRALREPAQTRLKPLLQQDRYSSEKQPQRTQSPEESKRIYF